MKYVRIIPRLDIKGPNLVKGIHLEGLRVLGRPEKFAKLYYEQGADELIYQDTVASLYQRNSLTEIVARTTENIFVPITVGGGIRSLEDINEVLRSGADKVSINTAAIKNPELINEASRAFGSSTIVVAVEAIKHSNGLYFAYTDNGREFSGREVVEWVKEIEDRGAGEILITSIDSEGTGKGFDKILAKSVTSFLEIPIIFHGGAGNSNHVVDLFEDCMVDGVAIASMLHYGQLKENSFSAFNKEEGNIDFLKENRSFKIFGDETIPSLKRNLTKNNIQVCNHNHEE